MSNTDELEAKAGGWLIKHPDGAWSSSDVMLAAFARSLAQPPSSGLVSAGNAMAGLVSRKTGMSTMQPTQREWEASLRAWDAALAAHPKDTAPTAERIMEVITEVLQESYEDDVLDWIKRSAYRDRDSGITQRIEAKLMNP